LPHGLFRASFPAMYIKRTLLALVVWSCSGAEIPAGTPITVRLIDYIDSSQHHAGEMFRASVDEPVMVDGKTIVPQGADALLKLTAVSSAGRFHGRSEVQLELMRINLEGQMADVASDHPASVGASSTRRTELITGGAAAAGAVVGGLVAGPAGIWIGGLTGGGSGAVWQVFHKGKKIRLARETRLRFVITPAAPAS